jgi:hypothetical protein
MTKTVDGFVITEEDTSQEEAALKMAASGLVDIHRLWAKIREFNLPLHMSPEGKLKSSRSCKLTCRPRDSTFFPPRDETPHHHNSTMYRSP